jgi:predicted nucleic acid-binding protein
MSGFLLDTNVISQVYRAELSDSFMQWLDEQAENDLVFLSVITVHELEKGIRLLEHKGASAKAAKLRIWLDGLIFGYDDCVLAISPDVARHSGRLEARAIEAGQSPGASDALIAGTAQHHGLTVITRNTRHFQAFGVPVLSPDEVSA